MNAGKYNKIDFVGYRHGRLTVISKADHGITLYKCGCDCGNEREMTPYYFTRYLSCGCLEKENRENLGAHNITHRMTETKLYHTWCKMKERCYNPNIEHYNKYGGRGITICDEWRYSFEAFRDWAYSAGYDETLNRKQQSLDRIDVNGNYDPTNCRWISHKEQCRNRTNNVFLPYNGSLITVAEFCEINGITYSSFVSRRLKKGLTSDRIIDDWNKKHNRGVVDFENNERLHELRNGAFDRRAYP